MDYQYLGSILKSARTQVDLKQVDVAKKIGCTSANISSWELGKSKIDIDSLLTLCQLYEIDFVSLLTDLANTEKDKSLSAYSVEALKVAKAYENADYKDKNIARQALDLPLLQEQSHPYMLRVAARGQGVFDVPLEHPLTEESLKELEEAAKKTMEDNEDL